MTTLTMDPFARQKELQNTRKLHYPQDIGESSTLDDTNDEETQKISAFIPSTASTEEGVEKLMSMMRSESNGAFPADNGNVPVFTNPTPNSIFANPYVSPEEPQPNSAMDVISGSITNENRGMTNSEPEVVKQETTSDSSDTTQPPEFTDEEVLPILDALLTTGCAKYTSTIRGIPLVLRTQYFWEDQMVVQMADRKSGPDTNLRITGAVYYDMYALAANLETFGGAHFPSIAQGSPEELQKSFTDRVNYLQSLPSAIITIISMKRLEFLRKVNFVITNFDRLIEVF